MNRVLPCLASVLACLPALAVAATPADWLDFAPSNLPYAFSHPAEWQAKANPTFVQIDNSADPDEQLLFVPLGDDPTAPAAELATAFLARLRVAHADLKTTDRRDSDGLSEFQLTYTDTKSGPNAGFGRVALFGNRAYWISYTRPVSRFEPAQAAALFEAFVDSVRVAATPSSKKVESVPAGNEVLEPGEPALTRAMAERFTWFVEWLMQAPLTEGEKQTTQEILRTAWQQNDRDAMRGVLQVLDARARLASMTPANREAARLGALDLILRQMREAKDDAVAALLVSVYDRSHVTIAEGPPPLTRQAVDAALELRCFMAGVAAGTKVKLPAEARDAIARQFAASYGELAPESREVLATMPAQWAALRAEWPKLSEAERAKVVNGWKQDPNLVAMGRRLAEPPKDDARTLLEIQRRNEAQRDDFAMLMDCMRMRHESEMLSRAILHGGTVSYEYRW